MNWILLIIGLLYFTQNSNGEISTKKLLCYYDAQSAFRPDYAKFTEPYLEKALPHCTHLMYGFARLNPKTFELSDIKLRINLTSLKIEYPKLKVYLSLGGDKDIDKLDPMKYINFLEAGTQKYKIFIQKAKKVLNFYNFDGLDLAFQFPRNKPRPIHTGIDLMWKNVKKTFTGDSEVDANTDKHKQQYTEFVRVLRKSLDKDNKKLAMTVLPNVNSTWYFDIPKIQDNFEFINLFPFDFLTPDRNPEEADYTAPIYLKSDPNRLPHYNIDYQVEYWIRNGCPASKLNLGIATYGRAWKLSVESGLSGIPIIESTKGPAETGKQTQTAGLLSYPDVCMKLAKFQVAKVVDKQHKYGNYAFQPTDKSGKPGIWISFDNPEFAGIKAEYVIKKDMGGVALYDLSYDDFRSICMENEFPILKAVSKKLKILHQSVIHIKPLEIVNPNAIGVKYIDNRPPLWMDLKNRWINFIK